MGDTLTALYDRMVADGAIRPDPAQRAVLPKLQAIREWLEVQAPRTKGLRGLFARAPDPPRGLYLWGGVGCGKSMLMDLFVANLSIAAKRRVHFHAFMQEVHAGMTAARKRGVSDALAPVADAVAAEVRLLAFDEMQITDITDAMIVGRLFERLLVAGVVIVTTSNRPPDDLYKDGLNRALFLPFIDQIKQRLEVLELDSATDYRQHRLAGAQVWFAPATGARPALDAIWTDLTGGGTPAPLVLKLQGRETVVPAFLNGVARATFWDLCGRPLGPADYLALAEPCGC
jgi:cell division protein ZapE